MAGTHAAVCAFRDARMALPLVLALRAFSWPTEQVSAAGECVSSSPRELVELRLAQSYRRTPCLRVEVS